MSTSTTCHVYWTNLQNLVTEVDNIKATCDSSLVTCSIYGSNGASEAVKCDSKLQVSSSTNSKYVGYFCACGNNAISVPSTVNCADECYTLNNNLQCNYVYLSTGFTSGSASNGVLSDQCLKQRCDSAGTKCTDGVLLNQCDNTQHDVATGSSTNSYVCNCHGAAKIPAIYEANGQVGSGKACNGASASVASSSSVSVASSTTPAVRVSSVSSVPASTSVAPLSTSSTRSTGGGEPVAPGFGLLILLLTFLRL